MRNPLCDEMTSTSVYKLLGFMARILAAPTLLAITGRSLASLSRKSYLSLA